GLAGHLRVDAARVVAEHAAEATVAVCRRLGLVGEAEALGVAGELIADDARLDPRRPRAGSDRQYLLLVLLPVDVDVRVVGLARERGAAGARDDRRPEGPARGDDGDHVVLGLRDRDPDRHVAVVRRVGRVERAVPVAEADLALDAVRDLRPERPRV